MKGSASLLVCNGSPSCQDAQDSCCDACKSWLHHVEHLDARTSCSANVRRQWLGDRFSRVLHENAAVAPQDGRRLREVAALAADKYGLPVAPPRLPASGPNGGAPPMLKHDLQASLALPASLCPEACDAYS